MEKDWLRPDVFKNKKRKSYFDVDKRQARCFEKDLKTIFDKCDNVCSDIGKKAAGINGQYTLGIFKVDIEDYEKRRYTIKYYFCADWKMAANVLELYAASSNFPCLWCETHKDNLYLIDGSSKRSFKKQLVVIQKASNTKDKHFGYKTHPIISDIEHSRYLIDLLHLFLRISDVLFELFISELATFDNFSTSSTYSVMKHPILTILICYLNENCGIKLNIFQNEKKSINSIMSNLPATNRIKVFEKLNIETLLVNKLKNATQINKIWPSFYQIYTSLKNTPSPGADVIKRSTET
ncbi:hypothetical protein BpHYR1_015410 [Brachionus plicatilis]|uniref:Uncharacterized protein n=1 Tax=Brachionus plicatilis TaxID=10195 RepID=A0A3M7R220_BRAPC|nr:hypothetical protein BpHYR1_015410 [Brachionus plicatilis]